MSQKVIDFVKAHIAVCRSQAEDPLSFTPHLLVIRDTSGSIDDLQATEQALFAGQLADAVPAKITYVSADTKVRYSTQKNAGTALTADEHHELAQHGGGGSNMCESLADALAQTQDAYTAVVIVTDGFIGPFTLEELTNECILRMKQSVAIPPIAFVTHRDAKTDVVKLLLDGCTGFPPGALCADYMTTTAPQAAPSI